MWPGGFARAALMLRPGTRYGVRLEKREITRFWRAFGAERLFFPFRTPGGKCLLPCPLIQASSRVSSGTRISQFFKGAQDILRGNCSVSRYLWVSCHIHRLTLVGGVRSCLKCQLVNVYVMPLIASSLQRLIYMSWQKFPESRVGSHCTTWHRVGLRK